MFHVLTQLGNLMPKKYSTFEGGIEGMKSLPIGTYYLIPGFDALNGWVVEVDELEIRVRDLGELIPFIVRST